LPPIDESTLSFMVKILELQGRCYQKLEDHANAIISYKRLLEFVWENKDITKEIDIYQKLAISNFYLGDFERATYYYEWFSKGLLENDKSKIKRTSVKKIMKLKNWKKNETGLLKFDETDKLPSP